MLQVSRRLFATGVCMVRARSVGSEYSQREDVCAKGQPNSGRRAPQELKVCLEVQWVTRWFRLGRDGLTVSTHCAQW